MSDTLAETQAYWTTPTTTTTTTFPNSQYIYPPYTYPPPPSYTIGAPIVTPDYRDEEIKALRTCLHEAYAEIGRLHEQLRGLIAFDEMSKKMAESRK